MKQAFLRRTRRERFLILIFVFAAAIVWLISVSGRLGSTWRERRTTAIDAEAQRITLEEGPAIQARAARAAASLDAAQTLDATHLVGEVSAIASRNGLSPAVEPPRTQHTGQFSYHTVQVSFRRASLDALVKFYRELGARAPYLALEQCSVSASRANPSELDAQFTIFSVQVTK